MHCDVHVAAENKHILPPFGSLDSFWITRSQRSRRRDKGLFSLELSTACSTYHTVLIERSFLSCETWPGTQRILSGTAPACFCFRGLHRGYLITYSMFKQHLLSPMIPYCVLVISSAYMLSLPDSPGDSRNLVKSPDLPVGRMNLPDFYHIEIRLKSTLMAENPYKTSPFSV